MFQLTTLTDLNELKDLRTLYQRSYTDNIVGFHVLDNFVKWLEHDPLLKHVTVYSLDQQWRQSGLYLIVDRYALFLNSLTPADERLGEAVKLLDWSRGYKITALPEAQHDIVTNALRELNIQFREVKLHVRRLQKENALEFQTHCPAEFELRSLDQSAAAIINSNWYSKQAGSLFFFERLIAKNLSLGIYRRDTQELIAWCTRCQNGFLGSLFVKENYRRRGVAELLIKNFALHLASSSNPEDTFSAANISNHVSNALLSKMGFEVVTDVFHIVAYCVPGGMEWPLDDRL